MTLNSKLPSKSEVTTFRGLPSTRKRWKNLHRCPPLLPQVRTMDLLEIKGVLVVVRIHRVWWTVKLV